MEPPRFVLALVSLAASAAPLGAQSGVSLSTGYDQAARAPIPAGEPDPEYTVLGPEGSGIGPRPAVVVPADGYPIPPWYEGAADPRWIGLDGGDSVGPAGIYVYEVSLTLGREVNARKVELQGGWAAAERGVEVSVNGVPLSAPGAAADALTIFPASAGRGLFAGGRNTLRFQVEAPAPGPTGLRVEAWVDAVASPDPLDLSTGFQQSSAHTLADGEPDEDYTATDPEGNTFAALTIAESEVLAQGWIPGAGTSRWIGLPGGSPAAAPGAYVFQALLEIGAAEEAARMELQGGWAGSPEAARVAINGVPAGPVGGARPDALTPFPPGLGLGLFQAGSNAIEFMVESRAGARPVALRVDAVIAPAGGREPRFVRGDFDAAGGIDISDAVAGLAYLFTGGPPPGCADALDAVDDGRVDITDPVYLLQYLFLGGAPPEPPFPSCGGDPTVDALDCAAFPACG